MKGYVAMYKVTVLKTLAECRDLKCQWAALVDSMAYPSPFTHPEWVLTALEHNEKNKWRPYVVSVTHQNRLIALLPLYKIESGGVRELRYAGDTYYPDPLGLCCSLEDQKICIQEIKKYLLRENDWDVLCLNWLLQDESEEWASAGAVSHIGPIEPFLKLPELFETYLQSFKRKKRYNLNAAARNFEKAGGSYHKAEIDDRQNILKHLFSLHEKRAVEREIVSSFAGADIVKFHENIMINMDNVWIRYLQLNENIIAVLYGFLLKNRFFYYQIAHDPKFKIKSPGAVILYNIIKECCESEIIEFNFLQGDESYKWQWTKDSRTLYMVKLYNRSVHGVLSKYRDNARFLAKKIFRSSKL